MKNLSLFLILLSFCCCSTNSTNNNENASDSLDYVNDSLANLHPSLLDEDYWNDTTEYTPKEIIELRDTLIGNFSGKGIDTLIAEPTGLCTMRKNFKITSKNGSVAPLYVEEIWSVSLIAEGDLDGNGTDEFGIWWHLEMGNWSNYYIFTYQNNQWNLLIEPLNSFSSHFYEDLKVVNAVMPSKKKGYVKATESHGGDDFYIEHKTVKINPQPLPKGIIRFGEIVE